MQKIKIFGIPYLKKGSGIHIKKKNRGKFTEYCGGKVTDECISRAKKSKNPKLRKRATFAANARKWKHEEGGSVHKPFGHRAITDNGWQSTKELKKKKRPLIAISAKSGTSLENPTKDTEKKPVNKRPVPGFMPLARNTKKEKKDFKVSPKKDKVVGVKQIGVNWDKVT